MKQRKWEVNQLLFLSIVPDLFWIIFQIFLFYILLLLLFPSRLLLFTCPCSTSPTCFLRAAQLKTVGVALSLRMTEHSSDLWLGFGSFVDKPVSPYINVHPSKIHNPCR